MFPVEFNSTRNCAQHALILQTCHRPEAYLLRTLEALRRAGLENWQGPRLLIADGYDPRECYGLALQGWQVYATAARQRMTATTKRAWQLALDLGATYVTHVEDDVVFAQGALDYIARVTLPLDAFLASWFTRYAPPVNARGPYWHGRPMAEYARLQCVTFPAETLRIVLASDVSRMWPWLNGFDNVFRVGWPDKRCYIHYPNTVEHIGTNSTILDQGLQVSGQFVGEAFDARTWLPT